MLRTSLQRFDATFQDAFDTFKTRAMAYVQRGKTEDACVSPSNPTWEVDWCLKALAVQVQE